MLVVRLQHVILSFLISGAASSLRAQVNTLFARCDAIAAAIKPLSLAGDFGVYIEPQTLVAGGSRLLLAGAPAVAWPADYKVNPTRARPSIVGLTVEGSSLTEKTVNNGSTLTGAPLLVPEVIGREAAMDLHVTGRSDGTWLVGMARSDPMSWDKPSPSVHDYWIGHTDGRHWFWFERLPLPTDVDIRGTGSEIVEVDTSVTIAIPVSSTTKSNGRSRGEGVGVITRTRGTWSTVLLPTGFVAYVTLGRSASGNLLLGYVKADPTLSQDYNSLFLLERVRGDTVWRDRGRVIRGGQQPVHHPTFALSGTELVITFLTRAERARSYDGYVLHYPLLGADSASGVALEPMMHLGSGIEDLRQITVGDSIVGWAMLIDSGNTEDRGHLRLVKYESTRHELQTLDFTTTPLRRVIASASIGDRTFVAGAVPSYEDGRAVVRSYLFATGWWCKRMGDDAR